MSGKNNKAFITFRGKIHNQGSSFATYIPIKVRKLAKLGTHEISEVIVEASKRKIWYVGTSHDGRLIIPCHVVKSGNLRPGTKAEFQVRKVKNNAFTNLQTRTNMIDLAELLREVKKTFQNRILKLGIEKDELLVITTRSLGRRTAHILLNRFVNKEDLGKALGFILSEGSKGKGFAVKFSNKEIILCKEFVDSLSKILAEKIDIKVTCIYNPKRMSENILEKLVNHFEKITGIIPSKRIDEKRPGNHLFEVGINNAALNDSLLTLLDQVVRRQADKKLEEQVVLSGLKGDGSLSIFQKEKRTKLNIAETNPIFQQFYTRYCESHSLHVIEINSRNGLCASCPFEGLIHLYKMKAFEGTVQYPRLIAAIALSLTQRRTKYIRVLMQLKEEAIKGFRSEDIMKIYEIRERSKGVTRLMEILQSGLIKRKRIFNHAPIARSVYKVTKKTQELLIILNKWKIEYEKLKEKLYSKDVIETIEKVKITFPGKNSGSSSVGNYLCLD